MNQKRKPGRPKGAKSFVQISLEQLNALLPPCVEIPVSRVWLESLGLPSAIANPAPKPIAATKPKEEKLEFSVE